MFEMLAESGIAHLRKMQRVQAHQRVRARHGHYASGLRCVHSLPSAFQEAPSHLSWLVHLPHLQPHLQLRGTKQQDEAPAATLPQLLSATGSAQEQRTYLQKV